MGSRTLAWFGLRSLFAFSIKSLTCEADMKRFVDFSEDCGAGCASGFGVGCLASAMAVTRVRARPLMTMVRIKASRCGSPRPLTFALAETGLPQGFDGIRRFKPFACASYASRGAETISLQHTQR